VSSYRNVLGDKFRECEQCSLNRSPHGADYDEAHVEVVRAYPGEDVLVKFLALFPPQLRELRVVDGVVSYGGLAKNRRPLVGERELGRRIVYIVKRLSVAD
jgi:hypothetical protein